MNQSHIDKLDIFPAEGTRGNVRHEETAYVERNNSSYNAHCKAYELTTTDNKDGERIIKLSTLYRINKTTRLIQLINSSDMGHAKSIIMNGNTLQYHIPTKLRVGRPRCNLSKETLDEYWLYIISDRMRHPSYAQEQQPEQIQIGTKLHIASANHRSIIRQAARANCVPNSKVEGLELNVTSDPWADEDANKLIKCFEEHGLPEDKKVLSDKIDEAGNTDICFRHKPYMPLQNKHDIFE